jgi:hypothetical protein
MNSRHTSIRPGSVRALVALVLLAGVFTMHGLTGNHDSAMAMTSHLPSTAVVHETAPAAGHPDTAAAAHSMGMKHRPAGAPTVASSAVPAGSGVFVEPSSEGHLHSMGDVCLAMLAALLLALVVALARRSLTAAHPVVLAPTTVPVATDGPSPPWRRPTLPKLCVLRT